MKKLLKSTYFLLAAIMLLGIVLRLLYAGHGYLERDEVLFLRLAEAKDVFPGNLKNSTAYGMPPFLVCLAILANNTGIPVHGFILAVQLFSSVCLIYFCYAACRELYHSEKAGLCGALLAAVQYLAVRYGANILRDGFYLTTVAAVLYCCIQFARTNCSSTKILWMTAAFAVSAIGGLCRREGVELPAILLLYLVYDSIRSRQYRCALCAATCGSAAYLLMMLAGVLVSGLCFHYEWTPFASLYTRLDFIKRNFFPR